MNNETTKIEEKIVPSAPPTPKMRQIIIETDGNDINLIKAEVGGSIELIAILQNLIGYLNKQRNGPQTNNRQD